MTDFSKPQRMSLGAFVIYFLKTFKAILSTTFIFIVIEIFHTNGGLLGSLLKIAAILGITVALALLIASAAYFQIRFHVENGNLVYRHYIISRATTTIPLNRIHSLRTKRGLLYRLLDMRGVVFDTLAAKGAEVELILNESDWQSLLSRIARQERIQPQTTDTPPPYDPSATVNFSNKDLIIDALCQNHLKGMLVLGGFLVAMLNSVTDVYDNAIEIMADYLETHIESVAMSMAGAVIFFAMTYLISLVLWMGKVVLRYYNMTLSYDSKMLSFSHGLISRMSSRFAHDKICTLLIKRNWPERHLGLSTIYLTQAENASANKEEDNLKIYNHDCSGFFLKWWLGDNYETIPELINARSGRGVFTRSLIIDIVISAILTAIFCELNLYGWLIIPAAYMVLAVFKGICAMRHSHITLKETYLIIGDGNLAEKKNYLKYDNIEVVRIKHTPLTKYTRRVSLTIATSGSLLSVRSLKQDEAILVYETILSKSHT